MTNMTNRERRELISLCKQREGLETEAARRFLEAGLPTVESLMPPPAVPEVEKLLGPGR
jgi:hypothetical protein